MAVVVGQCLAAAATVFDEKLPKPECSFKVVRDSCGDYLEITIQAQVLCYFILNKVGWAKEAILWVQ